jgi:hypothetical protein
MHAGPDHDLGLPGEQLDLAAGAAGAVVQLVQQLRGQRYRVREPHGDVTTGGPPRHGMPIQHLTDLFVPVQAVDQRDGRGDGGAAAAALPDRHSMGMPGSQHHIDRGIQPCGHLFGAPLGFDVELAQPVDRRLGS